MHAYCIVTQEYKEKNFSLVVVCLTQGSLGRLLLFYKVLRHSGPKYFINIFAQGQDLPKQRGGEPLKSREGPASEGFRGSRRHKSLPIPRHPFLPHQPSETALNSFLGSGKVRWQCVGWSVGNVSGQNWLREQICCVRRPGQPSQGQQGGQGATREKERGRAKIIVKAFVI